MIPFAFALGVLSLAGSSSSSGARARGTAGARRLLALPDPDLPLRNIAVLIVGLGELGLVFVIPLFLQSVLGLSAFDTGLVLTALAAGLPRRRARRAAHPPNRAAPGRAARSRDRGRRHRRRRPHLLRRPPRLAVLPAALRLRDRRRLRDRTADERDPRRRAPAPSPERDRGSRAPRGRSAPRSGSRSSAPRSRPGSPQAPTPASRQSPPSRLHSARDHRRVERSGGAVLPAFRRSPQLQPAVAPVEEAFVASARRAAFIAAAFVLVGLAAAFRLRPGRQDEPEPGPT